MYKACQNEIEKIKYFENEREREQIKSNLAKNLKQKKKKKYRAGMISTRIKENETRINTEGINNKLCYFEGIDF